MRLSRAWIEEHARAEYAPQSVSACPELDAPANSGTSSTGLTASEYAALVRGSNGNFFDDGSWWLKGAPRGEVHVDPVRLFAEGCEPVTFEQLGFNYSAASPLLGEPPECGRYLTGLYAGLRVEDSWPQLLHVNGGGFVRLAAQQEKPEFGSFFRLPGAGPTLEAGAGKLTELQILDHDARSLSFLASLNSPEFSGLVRAIFSPGNPSRLEVSMELFLRRPTASIAIATLSGHLGEASGDPGRDADRALIDGGEGQVRAVDLLEAWHAAFEGEPTSEASSGVGENADWVEVDSRTNLPSDGSDPEQPARSIDSVSLVLSQRGEDPAASRPDLAVTEVRSDAPTTARAFLSGGKPVAGNAAVAIFADLTAHDAGPIRISYVVSAGLPGAP